MVTANLILECFHFSLSYFKVFLGGVFFLQNCFSGKNKMSNIVCMYFILRKREFCTFFVRSGHARTNLLFFHKRVHEKVFLIQGRWGKKTCWSLEKQIEEVG